VILAAFVFEISRYRVEKQTNRQTDKQTYRQTDRQTDRQTNRQTKGHKYPNPVTAVRMGKQPKKQK